MAKSKKKDKKKEPAWKSYLKTQSGKPWESKKDQKRDDKYWKNSAVRQRQPAGAAKHDARSKAYSDYLASRKKSNKSSGKNGRGGSSGSAIRDSGEYKDIKRAQEEDRKAGQEMAQKLKEMEAQLGGISPEVQAQLDSLTLANTNLTNQLSASATQYQQQLDAAAAASAEAMQRMEMMMLQQQQQAAQTQNLLQGQLQSTQTALQNQQRMSANLSNAYVPQAESSAQSVVYGDARTQRRRQADNSLNDLSIVSGVGTGTSNLAGLQLAG